MSEIWHADGTFYTAPELFAQTYILASWFKGQMIPALVSFLPSKTKSIYDKQLQLLKAASHVPLNPKQIMVDFESAAIAAFKAHFPEARLTGIKNLAIIKLQLR